MKNNKYLIFAAAGAILLFIVLLTTAILNLSGKNTPAKNNKSSTTPLPSLNESNSISSTPAISIVSTQPENNTSGLPLNTRIILTFNHAINPKDVKISVDPDLPTSSSTTGNTITITPSTQLTQSTLYTFIIKYSAQFPAYIYSFRTIGAPSDTFDFPHQRADINDIKYAPDVYLARRTPYSTSDYTVNSVLSDSSGYFEFTVTITSSDKKAAQQEFIDWAKSEGLTDEQIKALTITYK